jgi:hypothetical protein
MKKEMFDDDSRYREAGTIIDEQTNRALRDIFKFWVQEGYCARQISHIMLLAVHDLELESVLFNEKGINLEKSSEEKTS